MAYAAIVFPWAEVETEGIRVGAVVMSVYVWGYSSTISVCHAIRSVLRSNQIGRERSMRGRHAVLFTNQICVLSKWDTSLAVDRPNQSDVNTEATVNPIHP